jgi:membrane protein
VLVRRDTVGTPGDAQGVGTTSGALAADAPEPVDAPEPTDPGVPGSVRELTATSWRYALRRTVREARADTITDLAAALAFWAVLSVAPAVLALVSLLGLFGDGEQVVTEVMDTVGRAAPGLDLEPITPVVENLAAQDAAGLALAGGLLLALWSASGYVNAFARAMNRIYEVDEGRPIWKLRPLMLLVTLVTLVLVAVICVAMVASGPVAEAIGSAFGLSDVVVTVWDVAKWPVIVLLAGLAIAILYHAAPNVRQPRFRWFSVGSFVAIVAWALATLVFGLYVALVGYGQAYGALAGVLVFLLWLWVTNAALLLGAELDAELERARELQAGLEAEETLHLPPRDTAASRRRREQLEDDVAQGRALRLTAGYRARPEQ